MGLVGGAMRMSTEGTFQVEGTANGEVLGRGLGAWVQTEGRRVWRVVVAGQGREGLGGLGHLGDSTLRTEWGEKCWRVLEEEIKLACDGGRSAPRVACVRVDGVRPCPAHHHTVLGNPPKPAAPSSDRHSLPLR